MEKRKKVYIVNQSSHDFSAATKYGEIVYLSSGPMSKYKSNNILRHFQVVLKDSEPDDYIVPCALNIMNILACVVFALKHRKLNLLLFKNGKYIERNHIF